MADFQAIMAACEAVLDLLRSNNPRETLGAEIQFKVFTTSDFARPMPAGVSLYLYRISISAWSKSKVPERAKPGGALTHDLLVNLHLLLSAWGPDAGMQHKILGWVMRTLENMPILPVGLYQINPGVFKPNDSLRILWEELAIEDLVRIWNGLGQPYHLSLPYVLQDLHIA